MVILSSRMEVPLLERTDCQNGSIRFSQFRCSPIQERSSDPIGTNYKQDNCQHFTIRGYVAEVRKKDAKICWPFIMVNHEACDEIFYKSTPPLHAVNFRRWNCTGCLPRIPSSVLNRAAAISGESADPSFHQVVSVTSREHQVHNDDNAKIAECNPSLCSPKPNSGCEVNDLTKVSTVCEGDDDLKEDNNKPEGYIFVENKLDELRLAEEDTREDDALDVMVALDHENSHHRINCDDHELANSLQKASSDVSDKNPACNPSLRSPKPNSGCEVNVLTKVSTVCEGDDDLKEDNNKLEGYIFVVNKLDGLCLAEEDAREDDALNVMVALDHEDSPHLINCDDHKLIDSLQKASSDVSNKNPACENGSISHTESIKIGPLNEIHDTSINENEIPLQEIQNGDLVASYKDTLYNNDTQSLLSDDTFDGQDFHGRAQPSTKRSQHKPKMKLLADILRITEHCKNQEIYSFNVDTQQPVTSKEGKPEASGEFTHIRGQENSSLHKTDVALTQRNVGNECLENHDETIFLAHWLKKSKKSNKSKNRGTGNTFSNIDASTSAKDQKKVIMDLNSVPCASRSELESKSPSKQNAVINEHDLVCKMIRKKRAARKGRNRPENTQSKQVDVKSSGLKSAETVQHYEIAVNDCLNSKVVINNNKGKAAMVENEKHLEKHLFEDSSMITNTSDSEKSKERNKKLESALICQKEVIEEFPMDIVELLARNQYERCLFNATMSTGTFSIVAERKGNRKTEDPTLLSDFSESRKASFLQCTNEHVSRKFPHSSSTKDRYPPWSSKRCPTNTKVYKSLDVTERKLAGPSTGTSVVSGFRDYSQSKVTSLKGSTCANKLERQVQGSYEDNENLGQASGRNMPGIFSGLSCGRPSGGHIPKTSISLNPVCNSMNMNNHDPGLMKSLERVPSVGNFQRPFNTISSNVSYREGKGKLSTQKPVSHAPVTLFESGKQQNAKMSEALDIYDDKLTALQLLSMPNPVAYSNKLCFQPLGIDGDPYSQESGCVKHLDPAFSRLELGQSGEDYNYPSTISGHHHQIGSSSKPLRPRPRFGVLGKYLQKGISARSTKCETPFSSMARCSSEISCPAIGEEAPARNSQLGSLGFQRKRHSSKASNAEIITQDEHSLANTTNGTAIRPVGQCKREFCVINRNPAELGIIDDDCEYMMKYDCPRHEANIPSSGLVNPINRHRGPKRQKLTDLQELVSS